MPKLNLKTHSCKSRPFLLFWKRIWSKRYFYPCLHERFDRQNPSVLRKSCTFFSNEWSTRDIKNGKIRFMALAQKPCKQTETKFLEHLACAKRNMKFTHQMCALCWLYPHASLLRRVVSWSMNDQWILSQGDWGTAYCEAGSKWGSQNNTLHTRFTHFCACTL